MVITVHYVGGPKDRKVETFPTVPESHQSVPLRATSANYLLYLFELEGTHAYWAYVLEDIPLSTARATLAARVLPET